MPVFVIYPRVAREHVYGNRCLHLPQNSMPMAKAIFSPRQQSNLLLLQPVENLVDYV